MELPGSGRGGCGDVPDLVFLLNRRDSRGKRAAFYATRPPGETLGRCQTRTLSRQCLREQKNGVVCTKGCVFAMLGMRVWWVGWHGARLRDGANHYYDVIPGLNNSSSNLSLPPAELGYLVFWPTTPTGLRWVRSRPLGSSRSCEL